jgi:hypothetical protein
MAIHHDDDDDDDDDDDGRRSTTRTDKDAAPVEGHVLEKGES